MKNSIEYYNDLRQLALQNWESIKDIHPCTKGRGDCCLQHRDTPPIVQFDEQLIIDDSSKGIISVAVLSLAVKKAKQNSINKRRGCVFFDENQRLCAIQQSKPLTCLMTGIGAIPKNEIQSRLISGYMLEDDPVTQNMTGLTIQGWSTTMCRSCHDKLNHKKFEYSFQMLKDYNLMHVFYLQNNPIPMYKFILNQFANSVK